MPTRYDKDETDMDRMTWYDSNPQRSCVHQTEDRYISDPPLISTKNY